MGALITNMLYYEVPELSYNKLRSNISETIKEAVIFKRKTKRRTDKTDYYVPSNAKFSAIIKQLLEWQWLSRREEMVGGLKKVFYSLSENGRFGASIGLNPEDGYRMKDMYQMVLRTAATGIVTYRWDEILKMERFISTWGTSLDDLFLKKDDLNYANFYHRNFTKYEIEAIIKKAWEGVLEKKIIKSEIRYTIHSGLQRFVIACWHELYPVTMTLVKKTLALRRHRRDEPDYKKLYDWLLNLHGKDFVANIIRESTVKRKQYIQRKDKLTLLKKIQTTLDKITSLIGKVLAIYDGHNDEKSSQKFESIKKSLIYYTCPKYVIDSVKIILKNYSKKTSDRVNFTKLKGYLWV